MFTGLVEAVGELVDRKPIGGGLRRRSASELMPVLAARDSLTVAALGTDRFDVQVVPYTKAHTNLRQVKKWDRVNLECDMVGKYVARAAELAGLSFGLPGAGEVRH